jgi:hypothetical protein
LREDLQNLQKRLPDRQLEDLVQRDQSHAVVIGEERAKSVVGKKVEIAENENPAEDG